MKPFLRFLPIVLSAIFLALNIYGQKKTDYSSAIDSLIQTKDPRSFNGVIWITKKGKTKYLKTYGYSDFKTPTPFTLKDNFRIQSNSKQITAVLILREVEKGKIDIHAPIRKYLPDFKQTWADTVTVHHLLNNTSGVVDIGKPLSFRPGTDFYYSNPGYGVLGKIVEEVTGKTFIEATNSLFKEVGMHDSYCYEINGPNIGLVNGHIVSKDSVKLFDFNLLNFTRETWSNFIPAGGMISNAIDLNTWDRKLHKGKILKPKSYRLMVDYSITARHDAHGNEKIGYGYGVRINDKTPKYIGHSGKGLGYVNIKLYFPEEDVDVIVLENVYHENADLHYYHENKIREIVMNSSLVNK
jgi:D-alanyl-D-alanine carboxypeptidase